MPVIIIEGVDGSGKSTFADRVAEKLINETDANVIRAHKGVPENDSMLVEYFDPLKALGRNDVLVADRWHVGEMIYGPLYRGQSKMKPIIGSFESFLDEIEAQRIIMTTSLEQIVYRLKTRGEDYLQANHVRQVWEFYEAYAKVFDYTRLSDPNDEDLNYVVSLVKDQLA
jgi:thymidylate kinase